MSVVMDSHIWGPPASVPRPLLDTASGSLPALARAIVGQIRTVIPEYADDPSGAVARESQRAVREALLVFMRTRIAGRAPSEEQCEVFRRLGRLEAYAGRSHDVLQAAYRTGSQLVLQQLLDWERELNAPREVIAQLSSAVFAFIDQLASLSAEGYAEAQASQSDALRQRSRLMALLLSRDSSSKRLLQDTAARAGWVLPEQATVVEVIAGNRLPDDALERLARERFGANALAARTAGRPVVVVDGPVDIEALRALHIAHDIDAEMLTLVIGLCVPLGELASAARLTQRVRSSPVARSRAAGGVVACQDHLLELLDDSAVDVMRAMAVARLAPLQAQAPAKRVKYGRLLAAWLEFGSMHGSAPGVLDKHRQTLRYQMTQLERMFGEDLRDRRARLELTLALRSELPRWEREAAAIRPRSAPSRDSDDDI